MQAIHRVVTRKSIVRALKIAASLLPLVGASVAFKDNILHVVRERYGPIVIVSAIPRPLPDIRGIGKRSLLYEFEFNDINATRLYGDEDVAKLFLSRPISIARCHCSGKTTTPRTRMYKMSVGIQNKGSQIAKDYSLAIAFSGREDIKTDPGVRIAQVSTDALEVNYLYQQAQGCKLPKCVRDDAVQGKAAEKKSPSPEPISKLARQTYKEIGLTRDVVILKGSLEAHMFQTVDLLIDVPSGVDRLAILYYVECANCRWFYRTESFGQLISLE